MAKKEKTKLKKTEIKAVLTQWSNELNCPIFVHEDGRMFVPLTGEWAGYFEEVEVS